MTSFRQDLHISERGPRHAPWSSICSLCFSFCCRPKNSFLPNKANYSPPPSLGQRPETPRMQLSIPIANLLPDKPLPVFPRGSATGESEGSWVIDTVPQNRDNDLAAVALARAGVSRVFRNSESMSVGDRADLALGIFANSDIETAAVAPNETRLYASPSWQKRPRRR
jgi:hypothetical protein